MRLIQAILLSGSLSMIIGAIELLWPLNNATYTSEVIVNSPDQDKTADCGLTFTNESPSGIPFSTVHFDGFSGVDMHLKNNGKVTDFSFSGWFKSSKNTATIFHYKTEDVNVRLQELKLYIDSGKIHASMTAGGETRDVSSIITGFSTYTWYYFSLAIETSNGKFHIQIDNFKFNPDLEFVTNVEMTGPGILRIGKTFDDSIAPLPGSATCFAFRREDIESKSSETLQQCSSLPTQWHPECPERNIGYYSRYSGATDLLEQINTSNQCSIVTCALSCLRNRHCKFIQYEDTVEGCKICVLLKHGSGNYNPSHGHVSKLDYYE